MNFDFVPFKPGVRAASVSHGLFSLVYRKEFRLHGEYYVTSSRQSKDLAERRKIKEEGETAKKN